MSTCERCGATFHCAMKDPARTGRGETPCWCTLLPPAVPVPRQEGDDASTTVGCWCPACLAAHIAGLRKP
jgi:Cysteine-rich CWC